MPRSTKKQQLTPSTRGRVYQARLDGHTFESIALDFDISKSTASETYYRYKELGCGNDRPRSGRPTTVRTAQMECRVLRDIQSNNRDGWKRVADRIEGVSAASVQKIANAAGIHGCKPVAKPYISEANRTKRMTYAINYASFDWRTAMFTDEMSQRIDKPPGNEHVSRKPGEELKKENLQSACTGSGGSVMFWGAISWYGKSKLIQLHWEGAVLDKNGKPKKAGFKNHHYADQILRKALPEFLEEQKKISGHDFCVLEDGAPPHHGPSVRKAQQEVPYNTLPHPAKSPDLNPIENLWNLVKHRTWDIPGSHNSMNNLISATIQAWESISLDEIRKVIESMPRRFEALLDNDGYATKY